MANDALILPYSTRPVTSVLVQAALDEQLYEAKLWKRNVALQLFAGVNGFKSSYYGIGTPRVEGLEPRPDELFVTGLIEEKARVLNTINSDVFQPIVKLRPTDSNVTRHTSYYDNNAVQADWSSNTILHTFVRPVARWCHMSKEVVVSKDQQYWTQGGGATPKLALQVETAKDVQSTMMAAVESDWHTSSGPSSVTSDYWSAPYSFKIACDTSSVYLGLDRTDGNYTAWQGNTVTGATGASAHDMLQYANYSSSGPRLAAFGMAIRYLLCGGDLYSKFIIEGENRGSKVVTMDEVPEMAAYGFKETGAISINGGQQFIIHDPAMPANEVFGCNPRVWSIGFKKNFELSNYFDHSQIRGQPRIQRAEMTTIYMGPICHAPWANLYWTNVS